MFSENKYINSLSEENFVFCGLPQRKTLDEYMKALDRMKILCSASEEVLSAYTFGEVKAPGISDIDIIIVLKENAVLPEFLKRISPEKKYRYVFLHPFFIVPKKFMENISYIHPNSEYKRIYGEEIKIKKLRGNDIKEIYSCLINDVIMRHFPSDYLNVLLSKRIDARLCLVRLNALHHSFSIFKKISGVSKPEWEKISEDISNLRKMWFELPSSTAKRELMSLVKRAVYISLDFVEEYKNFLSKKSGRGLNCKEGLFRGIQNRISFVKGWNPKNSLEEMIAHYKKYKNFYSVLPCELSEYLHSYSLVKGPLSLYISKRLERRMKNSQLSRKLIKPTLIKRIQLSNYQVSYAMKLKHSHFPCFFPLGFKNTKGLKNKAIYAYVRIKDHSLFRRLTWYLG